MSHDDEKYFEQALSELENNNYPKGLWAKAFSEALGNENQTKAIFIRMRVEQLKEKSVEHASQAACESIRDAMRTNTEENRTTDSQPPREAKAMPVPEVSTEYLFGIQLMQTSLVSGNAALGIKQFEKGAKKRDPHSILKLVDIYFKGEGVPANVVLSRAYLHLLELVDKGYFKAIIEERRQWFHGCALFVREKAREKFNELLASSANGSTSKTPEATTDSLNSRSDPRALERVSPPESNHGEARKHENKQTGQVNDARIQIPRIANASPKNDEPSKEHRAHASPGQWWYLERGQKCGPFSVDILKELLKQKEISFFTLVKQDEMADWKAIASIVELKSQLEDPVNSGYGCGSALLILFCVKVFYGITQVWFSETISEAYKAKHFEQTLMLLLFIGLFFLVKRLFFVKSE